MSFYLWLAFRYLKGGRYFLSPTIWLGIVGLSFGVGALVVAMAVVSGFEATLTKNVTDMVGHLMIKRRGQPTSVEAPWFSDIQPLLDGFQERTPFAMVEGIMAGQNKVSGIFLEGVDDQSFRKVMTIDQRVIAGSFDIGSKDGVTGALMGKNLVKNYGLKIGDRFKVITPVESPGDNSKFKSKALTLRLTGILELGRHEYNERYIMTHLHAVQKFADLGDKVTGFRVRLADHNKARPIRDLLQREKQNEVYVLDYREGYNNLFQAVAIEKVVIFFVLLMIVIAASFNISISLFINVVRRYRDVAILKTVGGRNVFVLMLFSIQGLIVGLIGVFLGLLLGLVFCQSFMWAQNYFHLIPGEIYKIEELRVDLRMADVLLVTGITMLIAFISSLAPALRGARLDPVEGLRYE